MNELSFIFPNPNIPPHPSQTFFRQNLLVLVLAFAWEMDLRPCFKESGGLLKIRKSVAFCAQKTKISKASKIYPFHGP
jgi:hypothetical protein